ncbi:MAG: PhoH family protein [Verrucomicrobiota bacterium]|nr:PhoH family protein [Verrucomicrobiota bacterium]
MSKKSKPKIKTYILDTCVLLQDPEAYLKFENNTVIIPSEVIRELERHKSEIGTERGANARTLSLAFRKLLHTGKRVDRHICCQLRTKGMLHFVTNPDLTETWPSQYDPPRGQVLSTLLTDITDSMDQRILACAAYVEHNFEAPVILVTNDNNMAILGELIGLTVEAYRNESVDNKEVTHPDPTYYGIVEGTPHLLQELRNLMELQFPPSVMENVLEQVPDLMLNDYVIFTADDDKEPARYVGDGHFKALPFKQHYNIQLPTMTKPVRLKNIEQRIFFNAMVDPEIAVVQAKSCAGTGKTFLALLAGLNQTISGPETRRFERILVTRAMVEIGKDPGALPGGLEEKMAPWLLCYYDNLGVIFRREPVFPPDESQPAEGNTKKSQKRQKLEQQKAVQLTRQAHRIPNKAQGEDFPQGGPKLPFQWLFDEGIIEITALAYFRGRTLTNAFIIVDEAQNMTKSQVRTILTRAGEGTKIILLGDPGQIDHPTLSAKTNGLTLSRILLRGKEGYAQPILTESVRSAAAKIAAAALV